jgi:hypothetical protein
LKENSVGRHRGLSQFIQLKVYMLYGETSPIGYAWCFAPCYGTWN